MYSKHSIIKIKRTTLFSILLSIMTLVSVSSLASLSLETLSKNKVTAKETSSTKSTKYKQAKAGYRFQFPQDHYSHNDYKTEWWYYTGHLKTESNKRYGYELTFFRVGNDILSLPLSSSWRADQIYAAHFALSDENKRTFYFDEKLNRGGIGLAGAKTDAFHVWNEDWQLTFNPETKQHYIKASMPMSDKNNSKSPEHIQLSLTLTPTKAPIIHGKNGISQKASCEGCASHYYSLTRLKTTGDISIRGKAQSVTGLSWMDKEFGSNQLADNQTGWDWFSIQLDNNTELVLYVLRSSDASQPTYASGTFIGNDGRSRSLKNDDFNIKALKTWASPKSKGVYPIEWQITLPSENLVLNVMPVFENQELITRRSTSVTYWEGSSRVSGTHKGNAIEGQAYVEMTGYAEQFKQRL